MYIISKILFEYFIFLSEINNKNLDNFFDKNKYLFQNNLKYSYFLKVIIIFIIEHFV